MPFSPPPDAAISDAAADFADFTLLEALFFSPMRHAKMFLMPLLLPPLDAASHH